MNAIVFNNKQLSLPLPVQRTLRKLGEDIRNARLRRRIPTTLLAERAAMSRTTLVKVEKGHPGVSIGNYAQVLMALGLLERLTDLLDVKHDNIGLMLEEEQLPKRVRPVSSGMRAKEQDAS